MATSSNPEKEKHTIPPELNNLLLEFATSALVEKPKDLLGYAADYFALQRKNRDIELGIHCSSQSSSTASTRDEDDALEENENQDEKEFNEENNSKTDEKLAILKSCLDYVYVFKGLDEDIISKIIDDMQLWEVEADKVIIREGDEGDFLYVIKSGTFQAFVSDSSGQKKVLKTYVDKGMFGELALIDKVPRAASVEAVTNGALWRIEGEACKALLETAKDKRKKFENYLNGVRELKDLDDYGRMLLSFALVEMIWKEGDVIRHQAEELHGLFFVKHGIVEISLEAEDGEIIDHKVTPGEFFGEREVLHDKRNGATVKAYTDTTVAFLDVTAFNDILVPCIEEIEAHIARIDEALHLVY